MKRCISGALAIAGLVVLILDTQTAVEGMKEGLRICLDSAIPSLFPFLVISKYLSGHMIGSKIPGLSAIAKCCGIPEGVESLLGIGWIGGYPVGAQCVADAYRKGFIPKETAERIIGFCNNAGPAFIFGISAALFPKPGVGWIIFVIQILSSLSVGIILPGKRKEKSSKIAALPVTVIQCVQKSIRSMGIICGWILCFRMILHYLLRYLMMDNPLLQVLASGFLELSNGCIGLTKLDSQVTSFVLMNGFLSLGGICVWMQTSAVAKELSLKQFVLGKILQSSISISLALVSCILIFPDNINQNHMIGILVCTLSTTVQIICMNWKISVASWRKVLYNNRKKCEKRDPYAVSQRN